MTVRWRCLIITIRVGRCFLWRLIVCWRIRSFLRRASLHAMAVVLIDVKSRRRFRWCWLPTRVNAIRITSTVVSIVITGFWCTIARLAHRRCCPRRCIVSEKIAQRILAVLETARVLAAVSVVGTPMCWRLIVVVIQAGVGVRFSKVGLLLLSRLLLACMLVCRYKICFLLWFRLIAIVVCPSCRCISI